MPGNDYRWLQTVDYLADFPGARIPTDRVAVSIEDIDVPVEVDLPRRTEDSVSRRSYILSGDSTDTFDLVAHGATSLTGRVFRKNSSADINVIWKDKNGKTLFQENVASVAAAATTDISITHVISPFVTIEVEDTGGKDGEYTAAFVMS